MLLIIALAMLPGFVNSVVDAYKAMRDTRGDARNQLASSLNQIETVFADQTLGVLALLDRKADHLTQGADLCAALSSSLQGQVPEIVFVGLMDAQGHDECASAKPGREPARVEPAMIREALLHPGNPVLKLVRAPSTGSPQLVVLKALAAGHAEQQRIIYAVSGLNSVLVSARKLTPLHTRLAYVDSQGTDHRQAVLLGNHPETGSMEAARTLSLLRRIDSITSRSTHIVGGNLLAILPLQNEGVDGSIVLRIVTSDLYKHAWSVFAWNMGILLLSFFLLILMLQWITSRLIIRPARILTDTANRLARGDLDARTGLADGTDDFSRVAFAFDRMAEDMQKRIQEIQRHAHSMERLNQLHEALSAITTAIHQCTSATDLKKNICEIFCQSKSFVHAWVGELDTDAGHVRVVTWAGAPNEVLGSLAISLDSDFPESEGYVAEVVRTGQARWTNDFQSDPRTRPWHAFAREMNVHSTLVVPMGATSPEQTRILVLHANERNYFAAQEIRLIELIAQDAAIGLKLADIEKALDHTSSHDTITGLPNETLLMQRMQYVVDRATRLRHTLAIAVLDMDIQSATNKLGLRQGNDLLRQLAQTLESRLDMPDAVGVLGWGRFVIVLDDIGTLDAVANQLRDTIAALRTLSGTITKDFIHMDIRAGIAIFPKDGTQCEQLLDVALATLDMTRDDSGEPVMFYTPETNRLLNENRTLQKDLRDAIEHDQLTLVYQPILSLETGALNGFEALLRWRHPAMGMIPPGRFIPLAEASGLIPEIGLWVIRQVALQAMAWQCLGATDLFISLNVSPLQLSDSHFVDKVRQLLPMPGMRSENVRLGMEVTEGHLIRDIRTSVDVLGKLRDMGIIIILDDFGTGYSSLSYLHHLPVDIVKIDKSFIHNIGTSKPNQKLVMGIHALAQSLGMLTVAEGIENADQKRIMQHMGCTYGQGFLFGSAMSPELIQSSWPGLSPALPGSR